MQARYLMKLEHDEINQNDSEEDSNEEKDLSDYENQISRIFVNPVSGKIIKNDKGSVGENEELEQVFEPVKVKGKQTYLVQIYENIA